MSVHPIDYRYFRPVMRKIFTEDALLQKWLDVESALAFAHAEVGNIPKTVSAEIMKKATTEYVKLANVKELEVETRHDIMAMVKALTNVCADDAGVYVHFGATSSDIKDTARALQFREALDLLQRDLEELGRILLIRAREHKETVCVGRTHGQHAVPTTYGMKFAVWLDEIGRHLERLEECRKRVLVGKMTGAVGTMASFGDKGIQIQKITLNRLELGVTSITNQVIQRDRYAELTALQALIAATVDKIAKEIRNLQRTEIAELFEPFEKEQVGSSTMPQKRNPIQSEQLCSISRVIKSNVFVALENVSLEHERDLTNSAAERIVIPENFVLLDYVLVQLKEVLKNLSLNYEKIKKNLQLTNGQIMAEKVMLELVKKGMGRQEAHRIVQEVAKKSFIEKKSFQEVLLQYETLQECLLAQEIERWLDPHSYLGFAIELVNGVVKKYAERWDIAI
ncbi:MAG: adenylosuccinate lyase [Candidatus Heimdallarchaeota archaeon]